MGNEERYEERYREAKRRVEKLKGFYIHVIVYICVNAFLFLLNLVTSPNSMWFFYPLFAWGIGVVAHGVSIGFGGFFSKEWEEKKIQEYMNKGK